MDDVLAEYQQLKKVAVAQDELVTRAEERLAAAQAAAQASIAEAKEMGFDSVDDVEKAKQNLEAEVTAAIEKVKEAVGS